MSELDFSTKYTGFGKHEGDEIAQLGQSLNRLSAYLEQTIRELKQSNDQLAQEIEEKERIDNMRQEFIVTVSHELKTQIALIRLCRRPDRRRGGRPRGPQILLRHHRG